MIHRREGQQNRARPASTGGNISMKVTVLTAPILAVALIAAAQGSKTPKLEKTQVARTPPDSGQAMYKEYCAVCHGNDGKGNGPAASALKKAPADLSTLTSRN